MRWALEQTSNSWVSSKELGLLWAEKGWPLQPGNTLLLHPYPPLSPALVCLTPDLDKELPSAALPLTGLGRLKGYERNIPSETATWRTWTRIGTWASRAPWRYCKQSSTCVRLHIFLDATIIHFNVPSTQSYSYYKTMCPHLPLLLFHLKLEPINLGFLSSFFYSVNIASVPPFEHSVNPPDTFLAEG